MKSIAIAVMMLLSGFGYCQIKQIQPSSIEMLEFSTEGEYGFSAKTPKANVFDRLDVWEEFEIDTAKDGTVDTVFTHLPMSLYENYWDVLPQGCSWYCGGEIDTVRAVSKVAAQGIFYYTVEFVHDFNYKTAWVIPGSGTGSGQFLEYKFKASSAQVDEIKIANGYVKSEQAWRENSRVKKMRVYYNGKPYAVLNLKDKRAEQVFKVDTFGIPYASLNERSKPWTLRFEILEVYPGTKFSDVAISEIHFMGPVEH